MSRIGKKTIQIPAGVTVTIQGSDVIVKGPKGELKRTLHPKVTAVIQDATVQVSVPNETDKFERSLWGTFAAHIMNMIVGVTTGYQKKLEVNGVGYRVALQGKDIRLEVGFSHPVIYAMPATVSATVEKNIITLQSADKELLGQVAAEIRAIRVPEPYKGKGIKYLEETIRRKAGKAAKAAAA